MTTSEILNKSEDSLNPKMAIIAYRDSSGYYLERRDIEDGKMTAGVALTKECMLDMIDTFSSDRTDIIHGAIPEAMLYADSRRGYEKYVWCRNPEKRKAYFHKSLNIDNGDMWVPGLIYIAEGTDLSIYAFTGRKRKKLYRAPFFNIYTANNVCLGSAKAKKSDEFTYSSIMEYWEAMFWNSEFTHSLANGVKGNLALITKKCIKTGCRFPEEELIPLKLKLEDLMK